MNEEAQKILNRITSKELNDLTPNDIIFLKARRSYLTKEQTGYFAPVLFPKKKAEVKETPAE